MPSSRVAGCLSGCAPVSRRVRVSLLIPAAVLFLPVFAGAADREATAKNLQTARLLAMNAAPATGGSQSLHEAITRNDIQAVSALIARGADPNAADKSGVKPLWLAVKSGSPEMVQRIISAGADVKAADEQAPLQGLAGTNRPLTAQEVEIARILIRSGANVNAKGIHDETPLHKAARYNHAALAEVLVGNGADASAKETFSGRTPLHVACEGVPIISPQGEMVRRGALETVEALLQGGASPDARDKYGNTPLHTAAGFLHLLVVDRLIAKGADVHARNEAGWTPLHKAARGWSYSDLKGRSHEFCDEQVFRLLIVRGADRNAKDNKGNSPSSLMNPQCSRPSMPPGVRTMQEKLKTMNKLALLSTLVPGLSTSDVVAIVGPNHGFEDKACVFGNAVGYGAIYKYWEDGVYHRLYFKIPPPRDMVLNIAGVQKSTQVRVPHSAMIESGSLVQYERNGELVVLPTFAIDPKKTTLRFFESGPDPSPSQQRQYSRRFSRTETRFVNWELQIVYLDSSRRKDYVIQAIYHKPDGTVLMRQHRPFFGDAGWKGSMHASGIGWKEPGRWQAGTYRVEMHIAGIKVADGSFEVH